MCQGRCQRTCERFGLEKPTRCCRSKITSLTVSTEGETANEATEQTPDPAMVFSLNVVEVKLQQENAPTPHLVSRCA